MPHETSRTNFPWIMACRLGQETQLYLLVLALRHMDTWAAICPT